MRRDVDDSSSIQSEKDVSHHLAIDLSAMLFREEKTAPPTKAPLQCQNDISSNPFDDNLLHRAVADAGHWAYGSILVEVWALSADRTMLTRPESGWWIDPVFHNRCGSDKTKCQICRLTAKDRPDYLPPRPLAPGEGLPGLLWSETDNRFNRSGGSFRMPSTPSRRIRHVRNISTASQESLSMIAGAPKGIVWREIKSIANDPDQPWNPRLQLLGELDLGWVAAVPFRKSNAEGIVVYMARQGVDQARLQSPTNEAYLIAASDLIGAAFALRIPRQVVVQERRHELQYTLQRVRRGLLAAIRTGIALRDLLDIDTETVKGSVVSKQQKWYQHYLDLLQRRLTATIKKSAGSNVQPPPSFSVKQSLLTFTGAFVTLLAVTRLSAFLVATHGKDYEIVLGPFGAFMTLLYGLTAAPASQPRNAVLGQTISIAIAIGVSNLHSLTHWMKQSLATSIAVTVMVKFGITHPPAGASALLFSTGRFGWGNMAAVILGNIIAISCATLVNNSSDQRQYPTFWGFQSK